MGNEEKSLYIPTNTPDADDRVAGLGDKELVILGGIVIVVFFLCVAMVSSSGKLVVTMMLGAMVLGITVITIRRDIYRENLFKKIKIWRNFTRSQNCFLYKHYNIYEGYVKSEGD